MVTSWLYVVLTTPRLHPDIHGNLSYMIVYKPHMRKADCSMWEQHTNYMKQIESVNQGVNIVVYTDGSVDEQWAEQGLAFMPPHIDSRLLVKHSPSETQTMPVPYRLK